MKWFALIWNSHTENFDRISHIHSLNPDLKRHVGSPMQTVIQKQGEGCHFNHDQMGD